MKLIAKKDFYRVHALESIEIDKPIHPNVIHKGAVFQIGTADKFKDLTKDERVIVSLLVNANCIGDANDQKLVSKVNLEILAEKRRFANAEQINQTASRNFQASQLQNVLASIARR